MPGSGTTSTYTITADATQALRTFREVTAAALRTQRTSAAGTAAGGTKFLNGAAKEQQAQAKAYLEDLEKIRKATARLKAGGTLKAGVIEGFQGGTAAQAVQFAGTQRQRNIATNIGNRAAAAGVADPSALVGELNKGFVKAFGAYSRKFVTDLTASLPKLDVRSLGSLNVVQLGQQAKQIVQLASDINQQKIQELTEERDQAARNRADATRRAREIRAEREREHREQQIQDESAPRRGLPPTNVPLPPAQASSGPRSGAATSDAQYDALRARQIETSNARRNVALLRDDSKNLRPGVFQAANDVVVDFTKGVLNLYKRGRAGEELIPHDAPEFQSALTGALQTRGEAFKYIQNARAERPQDVVDIDSKTTAVIQDGITRIFKAMQDGEREAIAHLPEFERNFKALDKILLDRANAAELAVNRARDPRNVLAVSRNRTVDFTGDTPRVLKENDQGQSELSNVGKDAQSFRQAISQAYDQLTLRARKDMVDAERAIRPQDFVDLGGGFFADIGNKQRRIYNDLGDGYDAIVEGTRGFTTRAKVLEKLVETVPTPFANAGDNVLRPQADKRVRDPAEAYEQAQQIALQLNKKREDKRVRSAEEELDKARQVASQANTRINAKRVRNAEEELDKARQSAAQANAKLDARRIRNAEEELDKARQVASQANTKFNAKRVRNAEEELEKARQSAEQANTQFNAKRVRNAEEELDKARQVASQANTKYNAQRVRNAEEELEKARQSAQQANVKLNARRVRNAEEELEKARQVAQQADTKYNAKRVRNAEEGLERARQSAEQADTKYNAKRVRNAEEELERARQSASQANTKLNARRVRNAEEELDRARQVAQQTDDRIRARRVRTTQEGVQQAEVRARKIADQAAEQQRLERLRASGRAVDVRGGRTVDFTDVTPRVFRTGADGGAIEQTAQRAPKAVREAIEEGYKALAARTRLELFEAQRALRPDEFINLGNGVFADIGNQMRVLLQRTGRGVELLTADMAKFEQYAAKLDSEITVNAAGDNVRRILPRGPVTGDEKEDKFVGDARKRNDAERAASLRKTFLDAERAAHPEQFVQLSRTAFADISNQQKTIYDVTKGGYKELAKDSTKFAGLSGKLDDLVGTDALGNNYKYLAPRSAASSSGADKEAKLLAESAAHNLSRIQAELNKAFLDAERAAHPEQFVRLSGKFFADISNKQRTIYEITEQGYVALEAGAKGFTQKMDQLAEKVRTVPVPFANAGDNVPRQGKYRAGDTSADDQEATYLQDAYTKNQDVTQQRANAARLRQGGGDLEEGVIPIGQYAADLRDAVLRLYKHTTDGFKELDQDSEDYRNVQSKLVGKLARRGRPGIGGALVSGLTQGGFGGGGEDGTIAEGLVRSAATSAKYGAIGASLYALSSAAQQAVLEFLDFDDSITELAVALDTTDEAIRSNQTYLDGLADSASEAGANIGEAMDTAASAVRAFAYDTENDTQRSQESLQALSQSFAREASRIAILTKTTLTDASGNLKAQLLGFDIDPSNVSRVTDAIANAKLVGGGDEKQVGQGLANISVAAKEAGFSIEEIGNLVSDVVAQTDQGGQLVAQRLSRIFSIIGGSAGQTAIRNLNSSLPEAKRIDQGPGTKTSDQIKQLSAVYGSLDEAQKKTLINQLGGTANARELIILLQDAGRLTSDANLDSAGKGAEEYRKRLANVRAEIAHIQGNLKNLIAAIANSGVLAPLDLILKTTVAITSGARALAQAFDHIPSALRLIAGGLVGILITVKAIQALSQTDPLTGKRGIKRLVDDVEEKYAPGRYNARKRNERERDELADLQGGGAAGDAARAAKAEADAHDARRRLLRERYSPSQPILGTAGDPGALRKITRATATFDKNIADWSKDFTSRADAAGNAARNATSGFFRSRTAYLQGYLNTSFREGDQEFDANGKNTSRGIVRRGLSGARSELNESGFFGGAAIAAVGAEQIYSVFQARTKINDAVEEFGKLRTLPDSYGVEDLRSSVANLRSAAKALREGSSGFYGSIINALQGDPTGEGANQAEKLADYQELASKRLESARKKALSGNINDLAGTIDTSSQETLSDTLDGLAKSGRNATEIMAAFQQRLRDIGTAGETATRKLSTYQAAAVAEGVSTKAIDRFNGLAPADGSLASTDYAIDHPNQAAGGLLVPFLARHAPALTSEDRLRAVREADALRGVDRNKLGDTTRSAITGFFANGGSLDKEAPDYTANLDLLRKTLTDGYAKQIVDPKRVKLLVEGVLTDLTSEVAAVTSVTDSSASFADLAAAIPGLASSAGAEAAVRDTLKGDTRTKSQDLVTGTNLDQHKSGDLISSEEELKQLQDGYDTLLLKSDYSPEQAAQLHALKAQIDAKQADVASKTVANMQGLFSVYQASIPPENTTQNIQAQIDEIDKELNVDGLDENTIRQLTAQQLTLVNQLTGSQIADRYEGLRAGVVDKTDPAAVLASQQSTGEILQGSKNALSPFKDAVDPRDTIANDKIDLQSATAVLNDYQARRVVGKSLADAVKNVQVAQRKLIDDKRDLADAEAVAALDSGSAADQATASVIKAKNNLSKTIAKTKERVEAQKQLDDSLAEQARVQLDTAHLNRQLRIDLSNPVATANENLRTAEDALRLARKQKRAPDVIAAKQLDVRNAQLTAESAAFSQFLSNVQTAEQLGDISHKAYLSLLQGRLTALQAELALMDPNSNGFQQTKDQITQLRQALKAGTDELNGQFNIGDIKIPTPYEVRRALKSGNAGDILGANLANSTAGNVTNDMSTQQVILNGVPIEQIISMIEDLFGKKVRSRATRRNP